MDELIGSQEYCIYRGQQYVLRSFGDDRVTGEMYVDIPRPLGCHETDFPDALEFGGSGDDQWIKLPMKALSRQWREVVHGLWRGVDVEVKILHERGQHITYCSSSDPAAGDRGLYGDQYQGWQGPVSSDEVTLTYKEIREYPTDPPGGVIRRGDVTVTRIPFAGVRDTKDASVGDTSEQGE